MDGTTPLTFLTQMAFNKQVGQWILFALYLPTLMMLIMVLWQHSSPKTHGNPVAWLVMACLVAFGLILWPFFGLLPRALACYYLASAAAVASYHCRYKALVKGIDNARAMILGIGLLMLLWVW